MAKGKNFLKVCGILMIIGGALGIIFGIIGLIGGAAVSSLGYEAGEVDAVTGGGLIIVAGVLGLIGGILELIAGIVGVKNCNKPEKSTACIVWGFIVLVLNLISVILTIASSTGAAGSIIVSVICSLAIPVLYLIGAFMNKKAQNTAA